MDAAIAKLSSLGFSEEYIREAVNEILQAFDGNAEMGWRFVMEDDYKIVINMLNYRQLEGKQEDNTKLENKIEDPPVEEGNNNDASSSSKPTKGCDLSSSEEEN